MTLRASSQFSVAPSSAASRLTLDVESGDPSVPVYYQSIGFGLYRLNQEIAEGVTGLFEYTPPLASFGYQDVRVYNATSAVNIRSLTPIVATEERLTLWSAGLAFGQARPSGYSGQQVVYLGRREDRIVDLLRFDNLDRVELSRPISTLPETGSPNASITSIVSTSGSLLSDSFPIATVTRGVIDARWTLTFLSSTTYSVSGQSFDGTAIGTTVGTILNDFFPGNPNAPGSAYFIIPQGIWAGTWAADDVVVFLTSAVSLSPLGKLPSVVESSTFIDQDGNTVAPPTFNGSSAFVSSRSVTGAVVVEYTTSYRAYRVFYDVPTYGQRWFVQDDGRAEELPPLEPTPLILIAREGTEAAALEVQREIGQWSVSFQAKREEEEDDLNFDGDQTSIEEEDIEIPILDQNGEPIGNVTIARPTSITFTDDAGRTLKLDR